MAFYMVSDKVVDLQRTTLLGISRLVVCDGQHIII